MKNENTAFSININVDLHKKLKLIAVYQNTSLNQIIKEAITTLINDYERINGPLPVDYGSSK